MKPAPKYRIVLTRSGWHGYDDEICLKSFETKDSAEAWFKEKSKPQINPCQCGATPAFTSTAGNRANISCPKCGAKSESFSAARTKKAWNGKNKGAGEVKGCAYCGATPSIIEGEHSVLVECPNDKCEVICYVNAETRARAVAAWNKRG